MTRLYDEDKDESLILPNPDIVFAYNESYLKNGMIALRVMCRRSSAVEERRYTDENDHY